MKDHITSWLSGSLLTFSFILAMLVMFAFACLLNLFLAMTAFTGIITFLIFCGASASSKVVILASIIGALFCVVSFWILTRKIVISRKQHFHKQITFLNELSYLNEDNQN